jgi:ABC-type uncharacterized transport system permease subunit
MALRVPTDLLLLVPALYAACAVAYLEARRRREGPPVWARALGAGALAVHLAGLVALGVASERSPFHTGSQALSFLALSLGLLYLLLERTSRVASHGGGFWVAVALLSGAAVPGLARETVEGAASHRKDALLAGHVGLALLGTAAVLAAGLLAFGYLSAYRRMKSRTLAAEGGEEGPSLAGLERLARHASVLAAVLLAPGLALGAAVAARAPGRAWVAVETATTAIQWALVVLASVVWWRRPSRGASAAWLNVAAVLVAGLALAAVHPFLPESG